LRWRAGKGRYKVVERHDDGCTKDVWEMSYSGDGRATFRYGAEVKPGETHVEWLRVGGHEILSRPE